MSIKACDVSLAESIHADKHHRYSMNYSSLALVLFTTLASSFPAHSETSDPNSSENRFESRCLPSFNTYPFINPRIVQELTSWVSDGGNQVVAIDLEGSQNSDRYSLPGNYSKSETHVSFDNGSSFGYKYIGQTESGVTVLLTGSDDGGSATWVDLLFVVIESGQQFDVEDLSDTIGRTRWGNPTRILKKVGQQNLGDRWYGKVQVRGNSVYIGKDHGHYSEDSTDADLDTLTNDWARILVIDYSASGKTVR